MRGEMKSLNRVLMLGYVGKKPEISYTPGGDKVARISLATNTRWKDKDGKQQERTDWHRIIGWKHIADLVEKFVDKGAPLFVEGAVRQRQWEKDGETRYSTEIVASDVILLAKNDKGKAVAEATAEGPITDADIPF